MALNPEQKKKVMEAMSEILDHPEASITMHNSLKRTTKPGDTCETYAPGKGKRITIEIPCGKGEYYLR